MPAVELTRIRSQAADLSGRLSRPDEFRRALNALLELYATHAYRAGEGVPGRSLIEAYRVPVLVIRTLEVELGKACRAAPSQALLACDALWHDSVLEPRQMAAYMLGQIPLSEAEGILERLQLWAVPHEDRALLGTLFERGTLRLRREGADALFEIIQGWLSSSGGLPYQKLGLQALMPVIQDTGFENLPPVFRLLSPWIASPPVALAHDLADVVQALARRSPIETAFFLRQVINTTNAPAAARLVRRVLPAFDETSQASLRATLRERS